MWAISPGLGHGLGFGGRVGKEKGAPYPLPLSIHLSATVPWRMQGFHSNPLMAEGRVFLSQFFHSSQVFYKEGSKC